MTRLVRAEVRKLLTTRLWWGLLIGVVLVSIGLGILQAAVAGVGENGDSSSGPLVTDPGIVRSTYTAGLGLTYLFALSLGIIAMAGEKRHQTMSATVLAVPRRWRIVVAKLMALIAIGIGYGIASVAASTVAGAITLSARGGDIWFPGEGIPRALVLAVLAVALWTLIGLGVGTLISNQVVALLVAIGVAWIVEPIAGVALNAFKLGWIAQYLPTQATTAVVTPSTPEGFDSSLLPWWGGALVLLAYALGSAGIGAGLTLRRDIT